MEQLVQGSTDNSSQSGLHIRRQLCEEVHHPNISQHLGCTRMLKIENDKINIHYTENIMTSVGVAVKQHLSMDTGIAAFSHLLTIHVKCIVFVRRSNLKPKIKLYYIIY